MALLRRRQITGEYEVMNKVNCRKTLDAVRFAKVRAVFARAFPALVSSSGVVQKGKLR